jgi:2-polyprenyl-3-methyl-5-hydroxy-6-metoxy-1,4-benzoquinol methylase
VRGKDTPSGLWLDVGCGSGGVAAALAPQVEQIIGIDPDSWSRWDEFARQHSNLSFHHGSFRRLMETLDPGTASEVICNQVYEHVDDPAALVEVIYRALKPGGICYFAGPNLLWPYEPHVNWLFVHWLPRRFAIWLMTVCRARYAHYLDAWPMHYWSLKKLFKKMGFISSSAIYERIQAQAALKPSVAIRLAAKAPRWMCRLLSPLAPGFVFVLVKPYAKETNHGQG